MLSEYKSQIMDNKKYAAAAGLVFLVLAVGFIAQSFLMTSSLSSGGDLEEFSGGPDYSSGATDLAKSRDMAARGDDGGSTERKRITTIRTTFDVADALDAQSEAKDLTAEYNGWVESESFNRRDASRADLTVRIPTENVSEFIDQAESSWELESRNENTRDVTDRYTEMSLELENKRQELQRLEELMNESDDVENLIKIQERMSDLRSRVQYLENNLEDIDERVAYTRVEMTFEEQEPITAEFDIRDAVNESLQGIFKSLNLMIVGVGYLLPFALLAAVIHYGRKALRPEE